MTPREEGVSNVMEFVETSNPVDLRSWNFFEDADATCGLRDLMASGFAALVTKTMQAQFVKDPPRLCLPIAWAGGKRPSDGGNGPPPSDPVMLYVDLPLGENEDPCSYSCSLEGAIDDLITLHSISGKVGDDEGRAICAKVAARLRELADRLDDVCSTPDDKLPTAEDVPR